MLRFIPHGSFNERKSAMPLFLILLMTLFASFPASAGEPAWHEIDFAVSDELGFGSERVALLLRAKVNGKDCHVQLDTGAGMDVLWHGRPAPGAAARPVTVTMQIGDVRREILADEANLAALQGEQCAGVVAAVGNAFFDHGTLTLDLGGERFAFAPGSQLSGRAGAQPMPYLRSGAAGGHPLVEVVLQNGRRGHVLLDTGAARFGLAATSPAQWHELSGGLPLQPGGAVRAFNATNAKDAEASTCYDTLVTGRMTVGGKKLRQTMVSYCKGKDFQLSRPIIGVLGLRPLEGRRIVIDYVAQRWLLGG